MKKIATWQQALIQAITDPEELLKLLQLDQCWLEPAKAAARLFPLKVPRGFVARMEKGNINDPLLRQVLPLGIECEKIRGYQKDPLQENNVNPIPGLLHKYESRVLLTLTSVCGVNCRYCFRRSFPYEKNNPGTSGLKKALDYIANDTSISEVILSGGDPLIANDLQLKKLSHDLGKIPHLKRLRIHSRMPIVLPERITKDFIAWIKASRLQIILVVHANHPQEINSEVKVAMQRLQKAGVTLLNQSVLLKDVNDSVETLALLSETLFDAGILPYYLHTLDKVEGSAHFDVPLETAKTLYSGLSARLSGFLIPKLAKEEPGAPAKIFFSNQGFYTG